MNTSNRILAVTPDNQLRRVRVSLREWRAFGARLARDGRLALGPVARCQANGLTVHGRLALRYTGGICTGWNFEPNHGGHPAFLSREGRRLASAILTRCLLSLATSGRPDVVPAVLACLPRIRKLAGSDPVPL